MRLTNRCIQSILDAGYSPAQVYCFDNGSAPDSCDDLKEKFPHVQHAREEQNRGFSGGFNRALRWVFSSPAISSVLFCTNDTVVYPGALEECSRTAKQTGAGMVAPCITYLARPDAIDSLGAYFDPRTASIYHYHELDLPLILDPAKDYIPGTALWIHRGAFFTLDGADESYHTYWEDVDMCFRAHKQDIPLARCPAARIGHGVGQTCHKKPIYTTFYFQRNRIRFCKRFLSGAALDNALAIIRSELQQASARWQEKSDHTRLTYWQQLSDELNLAISAV
jgi:hypothetical protein